MYTTGYLKNIIFGKEGQVRVCSHKINEIWYAAKFNIICINECLSER